MFNKFFGKKAEVDKSINNPSYDLGKIYPIIKGKTTGGTSDELKDIKEPLSIQYVDNLSIYFAIDKGDRFEYLNEDFLKSLNEPLDYLKNIAIENLTKYFNVKGVSIEGDENMQMIKFDQNLESSLLLVDALWTQIIIKQKDDIIIAVPSRELLIITTHSNRKAIEQLRNGAIDLYNSGRYKLTMNLLQRSLDGTLRKYD